MIGKNKKDKEEKVNPNIGNNHFGVLMNVIKKMNDPKLEYKTIPRVVGKGTRATTLLKHEKLSDEEKIGKGAYLIPLWNRLIDEMLESNE